MRRFTKSDIDFHAEYARERHAAVNVKSYAGYPELRAAVADVLEEFGLALPAGTDVDDVIDAIELEDSSDGWLTADASDEGFAEACELARETFGDGFGVYSEGRSSGWLVVHYRGRVEFPEDEVLERWNAIDVTRWGRFARTVRALADDQPRRIVWRYLANVAETGADVGGYQLAGVGL